MSNPKLINWLRPLTLLVVLALAFSLTSPVRAEGEIPTPTEPAATEPAPTEPAVEQGGETTPTETPPAEPAGEPGAEAPLPAEGGEQQPPADLSEVVDTLNENNLVLENSAGEVIPLSSEEAVEALTEPDPWFISGTVKYRFVGGACPPPDPAPAATETCFGFQGNPIQASINYIQANGTLPSGGAIYVDTGNFSGAVTIDGTLPNLSSIKSLIGKGSDITAAEYSQISNTVSISNMPGGFTLQGFYIVANSAGFPAVDFFNIGTKIVMKDLKVKNTGAGGNIDIQNSTAAIEISNMDASGGTGYGLRVDNSLGTSNVTITNAEFSYNAGGPGIDIFSKGSIVLNGVSASYNSSDGAFLTSGKGITVKNGVFSWNSNIGVTGHGLRIGTTNKGNITIDSVFANNNDEDGIRIETQGGNIVLSNVQSTVNDTGVFIENCFAVSGVCSTPAGSVTLTNVNADYNSEEAFRVQANGAITATNVSGQNAPLGSFFFNQTAKSASNVSISRGIFINSSTATGLTVYSRGSVTLNNIAAYGNALRGVEISNTFGTGSVSILSTLGPNQIYNNGGTGLFIDTNGSVTVSRVDASGNNGTGSSYGAQIIALGNVTISGTAAEPSEFTSSGLTGLYILTRGTVTLNYIDAGSNPGDNLVVDNSIGTGNVVMNTVDADSSDTGKGIWIITTGSVNLKVVSANNNATVGAWVQNNSTRKQSVTITGGEFNSNTQNGLQIDSSGAVTLKDINASGNSKTLQNITFGQKIQDTMYYGTEEYRFSIASNTTTTITARSPLGSSMYMYIYRPGDVSAWQTIGPASVVTFGPTLLTIVGEYRVVLSGAAGGYTIFLGNGGAEPAFANGVSFSNGIQVVNNNDGSTANVSIINANQDSFYTEANGRFGIYIISGGSLTLTNLQSNFNGADGVYASNGTVAKPYTIKGLNASYNGGTGAFFDNNSSVSVTDPYVYSNVGTGLAIDAGGTITVQGANATSDRGIVRYNNYGLQLVTTGSVVLKWIDADYNDQTGINVQNLGASGGLTATDVNASSNGGEGMVVTVPGSIVFNKGYFNANTSGNLYLSNNLSLLAPVSISDIQSYGAPTGITIYTYGAVTVKNTTTGSINGGGAGLYIEQQGGGSGAVSVSGGSHSSNSGTTGMTIFAIGNVSLTNVSSNYNGKDGIRVDSTGAAAPRTVSVTGGNFTGNSWNGLSVDSLGTITVTNSRAFYNGIDGLDLDNDGPTGVGNITVTATGSNYTVVYGNSSDGIQAYSNRNILVNRVDSRSNGSGSGMFLINSDVTYGTGNVTVTNSILKYNQIGVSISTRGSVLVDRVNSDDNYGRGLNVFVDLSVVKPVSIYRSTFIDNSGDGVLVLSAGAVTINGVIADKNSGYGVTVNNNNGVAQPITVLSSYGANSMSFNSNTGMYLLSNGQISISNVTANNNFGVGIQLSNYDGGTGTGKVIINGALTQNNSGADSIGRYGGVTVYSNGPVEVNNLRSFQNGSGASGYGIYIETYNNNNAKVSNSQIIGNFNSGIYAYLVSSGVLTLSNTLYFGNDFAGGAVNPDVVVTH